MTCRMALCTATSKSANALVGVNGKFSLDMCSLSRVKNLLALSWEKCIYHRSHGTVNHDVYTIYLMKHVVTGIKSAIAVECAGVCLIYIKIKCKIYIEIK